MFGTRTTRTVSLASWSAAVLRRFQVGVVGEGARKVARPLKAAEHRRTPRRGYSENVSNRTLSFDEPMYGNVIGSVVVYTCK